MSIVHNAQQFLHKAEHILHKFIGRVALLRLSEDFLLTKMFPLFPWYLPKVFPGTPKEQDNKEVAFITLNTQLMVCMGPSELFCAWLFDSSELIYFGSNPEAFIEAKIHHLQMTKS